LKPFNQTVSSIQYYRYSEENALHMTAESGRTLIYKKWIKAHGAFYFWATYIPTPIHITQDD
jgi:hypothetical protein